MSCDIVEPQYCSMHSEKLSSSELRGIIPTPALPGDVEIYSAYNAGGKLLKELLRVMIMK